MSDSFIIDIIDIVNIGKSVIQIGVAPPEELVATTPPAPNDVTTLDLGLWLDASQGFTTDAGGVTLLPDKSGNGHDAAPGSFGQPQADTFPNGLAGIRFDSANLEGLRGESLPSGDPPWTVMIAAIHEAPTGLRVTMGLDTLAAPSSFYVIGNFGQQALIISGTNLTQATPGLFTSPGKPDLMDISWRSPFGGPYHREWEINGNPLVVNTDPVPFANLFTVDGFTLGVLRRDITPTFYTDMVFGEVCLWTRELTVVERFIERQRLNAKWGANIASLEVLDLTAGSILFDGSGIVKIYPGQRFIIEESRVNLGQIRVLASDGRVRALSQRRLLSSITDIS